MEHIYDSSTPEVKQEEDLLLQDQSELHSKMFQ